MSTQEIREAAAKLSRETDETYMRLLGDWSAYPEADETARSTRTNILRRPTTWIVGVPFLMLVSISVSLGIDNLWAKPALSVALTSIVVGMALLWYLRSEANIQPELRSNDLTRGDVRRLIKREVAQAFASLDVPAAKGIEITDQDKTQLLDKLEAKLESDALNEYVERLNRKVLINVREEALRNGFDAIRARLSQEVGDLARRGNLNLVIGIMTTLAGLSVLGYAVFNPPAHPSVDDLLAYFAPRMTLAILIEVFAYFFLRLYKQSLSEIKYFQNEITNIESRQLALQLAVRSDEAALRAKLVETLAETERNFILAKDQTTVELERERMARTTYAGITDAVKDVMKKRQG